MYMGAGDLNSGPPALTASALTQCTRLASHLQSSCLSLPSANKDRRESLLSALSRSQFPWRVVGRGEIFHDHALSIENESARVARGYWQSCPDQPAYLGMSSLELFFLFFFCLSFWDQEGGAGVRHSHVGK